MSYQIFESPAGTKWEVWLVVPTEAERRRGERRAVHKSPALAYSGPERRVGAERRVKPSVGRAVVAAYFEGGWLCFESEDGEKRRLAPVPGAWNEADKEKLWQWCEAATVVGKCGPSREELPWPPVNNNSSDD